MPLASQSRHGSQMFAVSFWHVRVPRRNLSTGPWYNTTLLRLLVICDVYLFCFDMTQFYASPSAAQSGWKTLEKC